jgi:glycosyltransferase involved in cell wall biosynthesis
MHESHTFIVDGRWEGSHGIGRFAEEVVGRLPNVVSVSCTLKPSHPLSVFWLSGQVCRFKDAVFFSPGYTPPLWSRIPYVFTMHDLNHIDVKENTTHLKRQFYEHVLKPGCKRAAKILTVSEFSRQRIIEWSGVCEDKVVTVGNGVDKDFSPEGVKWRPGFRYLFHIGNQKPHKNVHRMLEAFACSGLPRDIKLVMVGVQDMETRQLADQMGIGRSVISVGSVSDNELPAYYRGAEALIFPSTYEGFGLPVIEAMACGTPVVTSNTASLPEIAGDAAILVDPTDVSDIRVGIRRIVCDKRLHQQLRERGLVRAKHYSWETVAKQVHSVLIDVASHKETSHD